MWEIDNSFQLISFAVSFVFGILYCLIYDFLRALRKTLSISDFTIFIQDILYFILISIITFMLLIALSNGEIRGYVIIGLLAGFTLCFLTFSKINLKILTFIFKNFLLVSNKIVSLFNLLIDKIIVIFKQTAQKNEKIFDNMKKLLKNYLKKSL